MKIRQVKDSDVIELLAHGSNVYKVNKKGVSASLLNASVKSIREDINSGNYAFYVIEEDPKNE